MIEKTFGNKTPDVFYKERVGAYGIGFDNEGKVPVAMTHLDNGEKGYFLLGGEIDNHENHMECIIRECLEEAGLNVTPQYCVCKGDYYQFIAQTQTYFHGTGYFYYIEAHNVMAEPTEPDHILVWLTIEEIKEKLFLPHQVWAVEEVYKIYANKDFKTRRRKGFLDFL